MTIIDYCAMALFILLWLAYARITGEQQILSRRMVAMLAARADRLIDTVRDKGVEGYEEWVEEVSQPNRGFRLALWLHRRFGLERMLTERLADRFEVLMVSGSVLGELATFNVNSIADLLGTDAEEALAEVIGNRQKAVDSALRALSLQYPGYYESVEARQLERAAIRFESAEYARRLREGGCLFHQLFRPEQGVALVVVNFIALLELAKEGLVRITQAEGFAEIEIHSQDGGAAWPLSDGTEAETESHPI